MTERSDDNSGWTEAKAREILFQQEHGEFSAVQGAEAKGFLAGLEMGREEIAEAVRSLKEDLYKLPALNEALAAADRMAIFLNELGHYNLATEYRAARAKVKP